MQRKQTYDEYRTCSPMRSPARIHPSSQNRQLSPIRVSPYSQNRSRQVVMSPIRVRHTDRTATTPTRNRINVRDQFARSPRKIIQVHSQREQNYGYDSSGHYAHSSEYQLNNNGRHHNNHGVYQHNVVVMEKAIKSGVGLFQKLVQEQKLGSERQRKQNRIGTKFTYTNNANTTNHNAVRQQCSNGQIYSQGGLSHHSSNSNVSISQFELYEKKKQQARNLQENVNNVGQMDSTVKVQYHNGSKGRINLAQSFGNAAPHMIPSVNLIESNPPSANLNNNNQSSKGSVKNKKSNCPGTEFQQIQSQIYGQNDHTPLPPKSPAIHPSSQPFQQQPSNLPLSSYNPQYQTSSNNNQQKPSFINQKQQHESVLQSLHQKNANLVNKNNPEVVTGSIEIVNLLLNKVHQRNICYKNDPNGQNNITVELEGNNNFENNVHNSIRNGKNNNSILYSFNMNPFIN